MQLTITTPHLRMSLDKNFRHENIIQENSLEVHLTKAEALELLLTGETTVEMDQYVVLALKKQKYWG